MSDKLNARIKALSKTEQYESTCRIERLEADKIELKQRVEELENAARAAVKHALDYHPSIFWVSSEMRNLRRVLDKQKGAEDGTTKV